MRIQLMGFLGPVPVEKRVSKQCQGYKLRKGKGTQCQDYLELRLELARVEAPSLAEDLIRSSVRP